MDEALRSLAARQNGIVTRAQAIAAGFDDDEIARRRANGEWIAIRRGAYMETLVWKAQDDLGRHRALCRAVAMQLAEPAVLSHVSAAIMAELPVWDTDLSLVHVTRIDLHSPRREAGIHHHSGTLPDADIVMLDDGVYVTAPARTVIDMARTVPFESAVVTADAALAGSGVTNDELLAVLDRVRDWRGARAAGRVVGFADGRSESVGESRHRVQIHRIGLPAPELQVVVSGPDGVEDRVDFYFDDHATIGEFDGREKYGRLLRPGETAGDAVWREKVREDRLRERGLQVVRPTWADLYRDEAVARRYQAAFARAGHRRVFT